MCSNVKPAAVLFDFYETLVDIWTDEEDPEVWTQLARFLQYQGLAASGEAVRDSYRTAVQRRLLESDELFPEVSVDDVFRSIFTEFDGRISDASVSVASRLFRSLSIRRFGLFADAIPTLKMLRERYRIGLVTDAQRVFLESELRMTGLGGFFDSIVVSSDYPFHKPDSRMFSMALIELQVPPGDALYVGDSFARDIVGASSAGVKGVLLDRRGGRRVFEGDIQPYLVVDSLRLLCDHLMH